MFHPILRLNLSTNYKRADAQLLNHLLHLPSVDWKRFFFFFFFFFPPQLVSKSKSPAFVAGSSHLLQIKACRVFGQSVGSPGLTRLKFYNALHQYENSLRQSFPRVSPTLSDVMLPAPFELVAVLLTLWICAWVGEKHVPCDHSRRSVEFWVRC